MADAIVTIVPWQNYRLSILSKEPIEINGDVVQIEKIDRLEAPILHRPGVLIAPLYKGVPAKLFLKRYANLNAYYLIGNFNAEFPSEIKQ